MPPSPRSNVAAGPRGEWPPTLDGGCGGPSGGRRWFRTRILGGTSRLFRGAPVRTGRGVWAAQAVPELPCRRCEASQARERKCQVFNLGGGWKSGSMTTSSTDATASNGGCSQGGAPGWRGAGVSGGRAAAAARRAEGTPTRRGPRSCLAVLDAASAGAWGKCKRPWPGLSGTRLGALEACTLLCCHTRPVISVIRGVIHCKKWANRVIGEKERNESSLLFSSLQITRSRAGTLFFTTDHASDHADHELQARGGGGEW